MGLEPTIFRLEVWRIIQLRYTGDGDRGDNIWVLNIRQPKVERIFHHLMNTDSLACVHISLIKSGIVINFGK